MILWIYICIPFTCSLISKFDIIFMFMAIDWQLVGSCGRLLAFGSMLSNSDPFFLKLWSGKKTTHVKKTPHVLNESCWINFFILLNLKSWLCLLFVRVLVKRYIYLEVKYQENHGVTYHARIYRLLIYHFIIFCTATSFLLYKLCGYGSLN